MNNLKETLRFEREEIKKEDRRLKEESWKLKEIEQQLMLQNKHHQKLLNVRNCLFHRKICCYNVVINSDWSLYIPGI